jgi:hypothetical protein
MKPLVFVAATIMAFPVQGASLPEPITPAGKGQLQCYSPNTNRKTCNSLASYKPGARGSIDNVAIVLISKVSNRELNLLRPPFNYS